MESRTQDQDADKAGNGMAAAAWNLAKFQPAQKEYQRYPGHPAMTSLSTVFPSLSAEDIYKLAPRIVGEGKLDSGVDNTGYTSFGGTQLRSGKSSSALICVICG